MAAVTNGSWGVKYRPRSLDEIVGNKDAVDQARTLIEVGMKNPKDLPATIGLIGPTGTGKTTMARIIAEALNNGSDEDYEEINCGTHGGIDDMRKLVTRARYLPQGKVRIFFLDEFHLLSGPAKSACLKLLEEPPAHARFIWGTDQPGKVLDSLLGRSHKIYMGPPETDELVEYLTKIVVEEKVKFGSKALRTAVLKSLCIRCDNMPRRTVNELAGVVATLNRRVKALADEGKEITKEELQEIVKKVSSETEESSPLFYAFDILGCAYERNIPEMRRLIYTFTGDISELLRYMASANAAVCRKSAGVKENNRFVTNVVNARKKYKTQAKAGGNPLASAKVDAFELQNKLMDLQEQARMTTFPVEMLVPSRLSTIV